MSPWPSSDSAPFWSRITRESVWEETAKAIREGTFALIMPVMTSTRGLCVASTRWMPTARAFCARRMIESSTSAGATIIRSASSSMTQRMYGSGVVALGRAVLVQLDQRARARDRHDPVAPLHLAHEVLERVGGHPRARDDGRQQVRDRLVVVELDLLGVDEHEPHLVGRRAQQDRAEHRVDAARLAGAGGARDEDVRHLRQVGADGLAADVLAQPDGQRAGVLRRRAEDVAERDDAPAAVGDLDADGLLARDRGEDADVGRGQRVGEVVLEVADLVHLDAGRQAQLVARDVRAGDGADDLGLDPEVAERLDERRCDALLVGGVGLVVLGRRAAQQLGVGQVEVAVDRRAAAAARRCAARACAAPSRPSARLRAARRATPARARSARR